MQEKFSLFAVDKISLANVSLGDYIDLSISHNQTGDNQILRWR